MTDYLIAGRHVSAAQFAEAVAYLNRVADAQDKPHIAADATSVTGGDLGYLLDTNHNGYVDAGDFRRLPIVAQDLFTVLVHQGLRPGSLQFQAALEAHIRPYLQELAKAEDSTALRVKLKSGILQQYGLEVEIRVSEGIVTLAVRYRDGVRIDSRFDPTRESGDVLRLERHDSPDGIIQTVIVTHLAADGRVTQATIGPTSSLGEMRAFLRLVSLYQMPGWDLKHQSNVRTVAAAEWKQQITAEWVSVAALDNGQYVVHGDNHGGATIAAVLKAYEGNLDATVPCLVWPVPVEGKRQWPAMQEVTVRTLVTWAKYDLRLKGGAQQLPFDASSLRSDGADLLRALMQHIPPEQWGETWTNIDGEVISIDRVLQDAAEGYQRFREDNSNDDGFAHMPEVLLRYYKAKHTVAKSEAERRQAIEGANAVKTRFLAHLEYLEKHPNDFLMDHAIEGLGYLLASSLVTWTAAEKQAIQQWMAILPTYIALRADGSQEMAHISAGLYLIEKYLGKLNSTN